MYSDDIKLSRSTIRKAQQKELEKFAGDLKDGLKGNKGLQVYWNKRMHVDLTGEEGFDCLPVLISGAGKLQPLSVSKLQISTGEAQAQL